MEYCCLKRILKIGTAESKDSLIDKKAKQKRTNDDNTTFEMWIGINEFDHRILALLQGIRDLTSPMPMQCSTS